MAVVIYPGTNEHVAHMRGVRRALTVAGREIEARAKAIHRHHRDTGASRITFSRGSLDVFVSLDDNRGYPAAAAIEYGHFRKDGTFVEGLHILSRAALG